MRRRGSAEMVEQLGKIQGLMEKTKRWAWARASPTRCARRRAEFILEGLYAHRRISRNEEAGFTAEARRREAPAEEPGTAETHVPGRQRGTIQ